VLGVDPAKNLRPLSEAKGLDVVTEYWTPELALTLGEFDCIVAQNVFAHVSDPLAFLEACATCLSDNGKLFIQTSQGKWLESMQYDYWYHEHISAFSVRSMKALLARAGLFLESVSITPVHGGSHSFVITKNQNCEKEHELETTERDNGRYDPTTYHEFQRFAEEHARTLKSTLEGAQAEGYKVVGFGAAAKGNTVLNFAGISLDYIVEDSLLKVGRLSPGMNIPICGRDKLEAEPDDVVIVPLAWNFFDEIRSKIKAFRPNHQDRFIRYFG
jgi:SAM-dependent methyltransferase